MPPVLQVAQQISQEENQQQNGPNWSSLLNSLPAAHSRSPALPQQEQPAGWDKNHALVVPAPVPSQQQHMDWSLFDVIGMENQITCYGAQMLPKLKVTGKFIEEICCSPSSLRLEPMKCKPNKHFRGCKDPLQEPILTLKQQQIALKDVITREPVCVAPCLHGANPSRTWIPGVKLLHPSPEEQRWCSVIQVFLKNFNQYRSADGLLKD